MFEMFDETVDASSARNFLIGSGGEVRFALSRWFCRTTLLPLLPNKSNCEFF